MVAKPGQVVVNATSASVTETNGRKPETFYLTLSKASTKRITVRWKTVAGTALPPSDYIETKGTAVFAPGAKRAPVKVTIVGDKGKVGPETFTIEIVSASGAAIGSNATITIIDND
jgi:Calx-beta domain